MTLKKVPSYFFKRIRKYDYEIHVGRKTSKKKFLKIK